MQFEIRKDRKPVLEGVEAVFFDAGGTLFEVRGSVGKIYSEIACRHGISADSRSLDNAFHSAFHTKSLQGFPQNTNGNLALTEKQWWYELVQQVLAKHVPAEIFQAYFEDLYEAFRHAESWMLYPDTQDSLMQLHKQGFRLGVISNFDSRLNDLLANLGIGFLFEQVTVSWRVGAAKPDEKIFQNALETMRIPASHALHVGDSLYEDVKGAMAAGLRAVLLDREGIHSQWKDGWSINSLSELC